MTDSEKDETEKLNEQVDKVEKCEDVAMIIKENEEITRTKKEHYMYCLSSRQNFQEIQR